MKNIRIALDWTPNTNHTGLFVARALGYFEDLSIDVTIISPSEDNYANTPAKKLELGEADVAMAPTESVLSLNTKSNKVNAVAIAALLQEDLSAIVTLKKSGITSPDMLDGKTYASYKARYEDHILLEMIKNAGGKGNVNIIYPEKLGIWSTLMDNKADATWIFSNWEGVEAEGRDIELNYFLLKDYNIPYGYSPVLLTLQEHLQEDPELFTAFIKGCKKGYLHCLKHPKESAQILSPFVPDIDKEKIDLLKSQMLTSKSYGNEDNWGKMNHDRLQTFVDWLRNKKLLNEGIEVKTLFVNDFLT